MTGIIGQEQTSLRPVTRTTGYSRLPTVAYGDPRGGNLELVADKDAESGSGRFDSQVATGRTVKQLASAGPPQLQQPCRRNPRVRTRTQAWF